MMDGRQTTIFDAIEARREGLEAMDAVEESNAPWAEWAKSKARIWLACRETITADDLRRICERAGRWPGDNRALGAVLRSLAAAGEIEAVDYTSSAVTTSHGRPIRIFRRRKMQ